MSFGAIFVGNSGQVQIDENYPCYQYVSFGTYNGSSGTVTVTYPSPINSPNAPMIFVKPDGAHMLQRLQHTGSAGNWTGWTANCYADGGFSGIVRTGTWKVAAIYLPATSGYGLQIFNGSSQLLFDAARVPVTFSSGLQTWSKVGYNGSYQGNWTTDTWGQPWTAGKFFMVNHFMADFPAPPQIATMGIGFVNGAMTQVNAFAMRVGRGLTAISTFNWPLVVAN